MGALKLREEIPALPVSVAIYEDGCKDAVRTALRITLRGGRLGPLILTRTLLLGRSPFPLEQIITDVSPQLIK